MRVDVKAIEGLLTACKAVTGSAKKILLGPEGTRTTGIMIQPHILEQVKDAVEAFEKGQKNGS